MKEETLKSPSPAEVEYGGSCFLLDFCAGKVYRAPLGTKLLLVGETPELFGLFSDAVQQAFLAAAGSQSSPYNPEAEYRERLGREQLRQSGPGLVAIKEAARRAGLAPKTLYNWISGGRLTNEHGLRRLGRSLRIDWSVLKKAIDKGLFCLLLLLALAVPATIMAGCPFGAVYIARDGYSPPQPVMALRGLFGVPTVRPKISGYDCPDKQGQTIVYPLPACAYMTTLLLLPPMAVFKFCRERAAANFLKAWGCTATAQPAAQSGAQESPQSGGQAAAQAGKETR